VNAPRAPIEGARNSSTARLPDRCLQRLRGVFRVSAERQVGCQYAIDVGRY
jgi:hypothetical protein